MVHIDDYDFGEIKVEGEKYTEDIILYPDRIENDWWRKEGHSLHKEDVKDILKNPPDLLIVGEGSQGRLRLLPETRQALENKGIEVETKKTGRACKLFNKMIEEGRDVVAVLHLTC